MNMVGDYTKLGIGVLKLKGVTCGFKYLLKKIKFISKIKYYSEILVSI